MKLINKNKKQKGQVVVYVLLIAAVVTSLGLSLGKRTIVDTKINSDDELLKKAFNAAESGVDKYLKTGVKTYQTTDTKTKAVVSTTNIGGGVTYNYESLVPVGTRAMIWMADHNTDGTINFDDSYYSGASVDVCLKNNDDSVYVGKVGVEYFYKEAGVVKVKREIVDVDGGGCVSGYTTPTIPILIVATPITNSAQVSLISDGAAEFPKQGETITSLGQAGDLSAPVARKVNVINKYKIPVFLLDAITAEGSVSN